MKTKFKVGDRVRVISESRNRYVGAVDTIESIIGGRCGDGAIIFYLEKCNFKFEDGNRLFFLNHELKLAKDFYWKKEPSINE